jgi:hypothetical protein
MAHRPDPWTPASLLAAVIVVAFLVAGPALAWRPPSFHLVTGARDAVHGVAQAAVAAASDVLAVSL